MTMSPRSDTENDTGDFKKVTLTRGADNIEVLLLSNQKISPSIRSRLSSGDESPISNEEVQRIKGEYLPPLMVSSGHEIGVPDKSWTQEVKREGLGGFSSTDVVAYGEKEGLASRGPKGIETWEWFQYARAVFPESRGMTEKEREEHRQVLDRVFKSE